MSRRYLRTIVREATATLSAVAFLIGLLIVGNIFGQVS